MKNLYKMDTWHSGKKAEEMNAAAVEAAKNTVGEKYVVTFGEWGTATYLVFTDTKQNAIDIAKNEYDGDTEKVRCRNVTTCKKYN